MTPTVIAELMTEVSALMARCPDAEARTHLDFAKNRLIDVLYSFSDEELEEIYEPATE